MKKVIKTGNKNGKHYSIALTSYDTNSEKIIVDGEGIVTITDKKGNTLTDVFKFDADYAFGTEDYEYTFTPQNKHFEYRIEGKITTLDKAIINLEFIYIDYLLLNLGGQNINKSFVLDYHSNGGKDDIEIYVRNKGIIKLIATPYGFYIKPLLIKEFVTESDVIDSSEYLPGGRYSVALKDAAFIVNDKNRFKIVKHLTQIPGLDFVYTDVEDNYILFINKKYYVLSKYNFRFGNLLEAIISNNGFEYGCYSIYKDVVNGTIVKHDDKPAYIFLNNGFKNIETNEPTYDIIYVGKDTILSKKELGKNSGHIDAAKPICTDYKEEYCIYHYTDDINDSIVIKDENDEIVKEMPDYVFPAAMGSLLLKVYPHTVVVEKVGEARYLQIISLINKTGIYYALLNTSSNQLLQMVVTDKVCKTNEEILKLFFKKHSLKGFNYYHTVSEKPITKDGGYMNIILDPSLELEYELISHNQVIDDKEVLKALRGIKIKKAQKLEHSNKIKYNSIEELKEIVEQLPDNLEISIDVSKAVGNCEYGTKEWAKKVLSKEVGEEDVLTKKDLLNILNKEDISNVQKEALMDERFKRVLNLALSMEAQ